MKCSCDANNACIHITGITRRPPCCCTFADVDEDDGASVCTVHLNFTASVDDDDISRWNDIGKRVDETANETDDGQYTNDRCTDSNDRRIISRWATCLAIKRNSHSGGTTGYNEINV
jgi:hypothetical protein